MSETATILSNGIATKPKADNFDILVLKFADSKLPSFREIGNKEWVLFGADNDYPEYLVYLYNKCGKHRAIINGKSKYIFGSGMKSEVGDFFNRVTADGVTLKAAKVNRTGETMASILKKSIKDIEIHGGFRWWVIEDAAGRVAEIYHEDFYKFRRSRSGGFYFKKRWFNDYGNANHREEAILWPEFSRNRDVKIGKSVFAYNEYGPGTDWYPLPEYVGCCNYIDVDIEISKFHLSAIRNGMVPSKMIQFFTGEPSEDKKKDIERRWAAKFAGAENAGKFVLVFNQDKNKTVEISDLSFSELDKQFDLLNRTCQQEIFTGHQVVSPMLFGVKTEGQLGGSTELRAAYEIFINTYAKPKQEDLEEVVNYFGGLMQRGEDYKFVQLDPAGLVFDVKDIIAEIPREFIFEKLGIPAKYLPLTTAPADVPGVVNQPGVPPSTIQTDGDAATVNENIKNLSPKQHQQVLRIIRDYSKNRITKEVATTLLRTGLGLNDADISSILGIEDEAPELMQKFADQVMDDDKVIAMFSECGDLRRDFTVIKSKKVSFSSSMDAADDEATFFRQAFAKGVTTTEASILDLISKDKRVTPDIIAKTLDTTPEYITAKIASLVKRGLLTTIEGKIGEDKEIERTLTKPMKDIDLPPGGAETTEIFIKYSYEGPQDSRNRPFCAKLMALDRLYTRSEIESISQRLGYSVWDRRGGWWTKPDGTRSPTCRHKWKSNVVVKKNKK